MNSEVNRKIVFSLNSFIIKDYRFTKCFKKELDCEECWNCV